MEMIDGRDKEIDDDDEDKEKQAMTDLESATNSKTKKKF